MYPIRVPEPDFTEYLVRKKYPLSVRLNLPLHQSGLTIEVRNQLTLDVAVYRDQLRQLIKSELEALYNQAVEEDRAIEEATRFFNQKNASADFEHWGKASYWTLEEGCITVWQRPQGCFC